MNKKNFRTLICIFAIAFALLAQRAARADSVTVADFEQGTSEFNGAIVHDASTAHDGKSSGRMDADFSLPGDPWITAERTLDIKNPVKAVRLWIKSSDFSGITFRMVDSSGQTHQQRPTFPADGQWHQLIIDTFDSGQGYEKWGGANDGKFHWPAASMGIIAEKGLLGGKTKGSLWVDQVEVDVEGTLVKPPPPTTVVIGDFETDTDGFTGAIARDDADAKTGKACAKIEADFSKPGDPWVTAAKQLDVQNELQAISFWVKSTDAHGLTFRMVDSTGQTHQQRPTFTSDGTWQHIVIRSFERGPGYESWGGAADHKFHWPVEQIAFIFEKPNLDGKLQGSLLIDDVELAVSGPMKGALDDCKTVGLATFENDTDGFTGAIIRDDATAKDGKASGRIDADFSKPGDPWVTAAHDLSVRNEIKAVRFWVKSSDTGGLTVRLVDATGQNHQQRPTFPADGQWHQITLTKLTSGPGYEKWGGASDGQFHFPAASISFILEKPALGVKTKGSVNLDDIQLLVDPNGIVPKAEINQKQLGNIFYSTETPEIDLHTQADQVKWTITDFWHNAVASGSTPVVDHFAAIKPSPDLRGYFALRMDAEKDGNTLASVDTTFAIITPVDVSAMVNSPFGVMTHFAQDWDTDIMPLVAKAGIKTIRDELYWAQVEQKPGQYIFRPQFEKYMAEAAKLHIDPMIVMSFANPLYDEGKTPYTAQGCDAYGRYGQAILQHFGKEIKYLEIWNEYNGTWCDGPAQNDRPRYYAQMLAHAYAKIKEVRPDVEVLGGASVLVPLPYFEGIFKNGGLASMDTIDIHPYRGNPEGVEQDVADLQELTKQYNNGKTKPICASETGLIDTGPDGRDHIARYLVRQYTLLLSAGVERISWYLCRDYNEFKSMGLLRDAKDPLGRYVPAPAYAAYANLIRQLYGTSFVQREKSDAHTYIEQFAKDGNPIRVCWANEPAHVAFSAKGPITMVDMMGTEQTLTPIGGQIFLTLTDSPVFVKGAINAIDTGRLAIAPEQIVDVLGQTRLHYSYDNRGNDQPMNGTFNIGGQSYSFTAKANEQLTSDIVLPDQDVSMTGSRIIGYELTADGKPFAKGGITANISDPLTMATPPQLAAADRMQLTLANSSPSVAYHVESIEWQFNGQNQKQPMSLDIPAKSQAVITVPVTAATPYQEYPLVMTVKLTGRESITCDQTISYNPCFATSGSLFDNPVIGQAAWITWDRTNFYLSAKIHGNDLRFGIADMSRTRTSFAPPDPRAGWYEFRAADQLQCVMSPTPINGAQLKTNREGDLNVFQISIPWASLPPITANDGQFLLAISAGQEIAFGKGIDSGKTPVLYRICKMVDNAAAPPAPLTEPSVQITALPASAAPGEAGKVLADSVQDYSNTQGRNNWSYGYYAGDGAGHGDGVAPSGPYTDDDFHPMKNVQTNWGYEWSDPAVYQYMKLSPMGGHPGQSDGKPLWAVRRWTSTTDGTVRITGKIIRTAEQGDGIEAKILVDGVIVWSEPVGGPDHPKTIKCEATVPVHKGSLVDIAITPGPAADTDYDATECTVRIAAVSK